MMKIIAWNSRGSASKEIRSHLWQLISRHDLTIVCLMEIKANEDRMRGVQMSLGCDWGMAVNPDTGNAGGIRILWRLDRVHIKDAWVIDQALFGIVSCVRTSFSPWILGAIYANTSATRRKDLWSRLTEALTSNLPCCLVGDFNQILSRLEAQTPKSSGHKKSFILFVIWPKKHRFEFLPSWVGTP